jgi:hypothetical protein
MERRKSLVLAGNRTSAVQPVDFRYTDWAIPVNNVTDCWMKMQRHELKVKLSLYRPWRPLGLREVEAPTFSHIRLTDGGKVVSPTRRPLFTSRKICVRGWTQHRTIVRLVGLGQLKKSTSSGTRTGDLPACSIVPQPSTVPHAESWGQWEYTKKTKCMSSDIKRQNTTSLLPEEISLAVYHMTRRPERERGIHMRWCRKNETSTHDGDWKIGKLEGVEK